MQNNFVNYTLLLQIKTFALVDLNAVSTNHIQSEIKAINKLLACATNNMEEYLEFMDAHPKRFDEKDKIMTIVYLGRLYRFFIVKNKSKMQEYLDKSIHFLRRFIQILKKDKEAKEFFFESHIDDDFAAMLEAGGEFECLLSLLDIIFTDPYIKKFRGDPEDNTCTVC